MLFDFTSIQQRLIASLQGKASWAGILYEATNMRLIDAFAQEEASLVQYDEYLTRETKWTQAQNPSSLLTQSRALGYKPSRMIGAQGQQLQFSTSKTFNAPYSGGVNIGIPIFSVFSNGSTIPVCTYGASTLLPSQNSVLLPTVQGTPLQVTMIAQGLTYEQLTVGDPTIENTFYQVWVNGVEWTEISDIRLATSGTSQVFQITNKPDFSGVYLTFGNNNFGQKLNIGDVVVFKYISTLGAAGNILSSGIVTTVVSTFYDTNGEVVQCYCTNLDPVQGGQGYETADNIRTYGSIAFQTGERATAEADYEYIISQQPYVAKVIVWGEYEKGLDDPSYQPGDYIAPSENMVYICAIDNTGATINSSDQTAIRSILNGVKSPTDIPSFQSVENIYLIFNTTAYVKDTSYILSQVTSAIISGLESQYGLSNMSFHESVNYSDYTKFIDNVAGVDYHDTTVQVANFYLFITGEYTASLVLSLFPIEASSIEIWVENTTDLGAGWVQIGKDDGSGALIGVSPYILLNTSTINYSSGVGTLTITNPSNLPAYATSTPANYSIKVIYTITGKDFQPKQRYQIITYDSTDSVISAVYETGLV